MPNYDGLVAAFDQGDVLFGLSGDLETATQALKSAYSDGASFWGAFSRMGRQKNRKAKGYKKADVKVQADLTNAVAEPGRIMANAKAAAPAVRAGRAPGGAPLTAPPMASVYQEPRVGASLKHEAQRGREFGKFIDSHSKFDPKLMGGTMKGDGTFAPLGEKEADMKWIVVQQKEVLVWQLAKELDTGSPLRITGGGTVAPRPKGQAPGNRDLVTSNWDRIDWARYDVYSYLNDHQLATVANYKIWKRTSKAGLEFQTTVKERTVHFLLDTFLNAGAMAMVVNKAPPHGKKITAGELRWLYRNWANAKVRGHTRFWTVNAETSPPWEMDAYRDLWATYQPKAWGRDASMALTAALGVHT